ncbi:MAG: aminopeptidase P family protein [Proteobacteria bacterium]|jgi:Xaa-Pro aminopeptidase/Xaa-Pro dipeptidase|nr:aminopeptidase P family protein [Pseudomonadota bacterium]
MRENRIEKVLDIIRDKGLDACALRGMENIFYLTGFRGSEGALLITKGDVLLLTDSRYITHAKEVTKDIKIVELREKNNPLGELCSKYGIKKMGFDSMHTTYDLYERWTDAIPDIELIPLRNAIEEIRKHKEPDEINAIRKAIGIATDAFNEIFEKIYPGRTEKEIANDLDYTMKQFGADCPSFDTIVASGIRAALPHAEPTDKKIMEGEMVMVDFGAQVDGYCSDETCTISVGEVNGRIQEVFSVVNKARELALEKVKVGMPIKELDMIVRGFIDDAGYGEYFRHGTGHGVGVAVHEAPAINSMAEGILEENMVITIEPGIYIPDLGGVRLEDMVLITEDKAGVLTHIRKDALNIKV